MHIYRYVADDDSDNDGGDVRTRQTAKQITRITPLLLSQLPNDSLATAEPRFHHVLFVDMAPCSLCGKTEESCTNFGRNVTYIYYDRRRLSRCGERINTPALHKRTQGSPSIISDNAPLAVDL